jgi:hypothetical protein
MTVKERLHQVVEELPEDAAAELERYAGYLRMLSEQGEWDRFSLAQLASRYDAGEIDYTLDDARPRPQPQ